jgi:hypothetical protein
MMREISWAGKARARQMSTRSKGRRQSPPATEDQLRAAHTRMRSRLASASSKSLNVGARSRIVAGDCITASMAPLAFSYISVKCPPCSDLMNF